MKVTNKNIRNFLRRGTIVLGCVAIADIIIALTTNGFLDEIFKGYSAFILPVAMIGFYAYVGMPIFQFNSDSNVLHIKSHMAFTEIFGKELYVLKKNILKFEIDRKRIRKKLTVHYLKDGKEFSETFSIALLNNRKIEHLAHKVELIQSEVRKENNYHLFI